MTITVSYIPYGHGLAIIIPRWLTYILSDKTALKIKRFGVNDLGVAPPRFQIWTAQRESWSDLQLSPLPMLRRYSGCHYNS